MHDTQESGHPRIGRIIHDSRGVRRLLPPRELADAATYDSTHDPHLADRDGDEPADPLTPEWHAVADALADNGDIHPLPDWDAIPDGQAADVDAAADAAGSDADTSWVYHTRWADEPADGTPAPPDRAPHAEG